MCAMPRGRGRAPVPPNCQRLTDFGKVIGVRMADGRRVATNKLAWELYRASQPADCELQAKRPAELEPDTDAAAAAAKALRAAARERAAAMERDGAREIPGDEVQVQVERAQPGDEVQVQVEQAEGGASVGAEMDEDGVEAVEVVEEELGVVAAAAEVEEAETRRRVELTRLRHAHAEQVRIIERAQRRKRDIEEEILSLQCPGYD